MHHRRVSSPSSPLPLSHCNFNISQSHHCPDPSPTCWLPLLVSTPRQPQPPWPRPRFVPQLLRITTNRLVASSPFHAINNCDLHRHQLALHCGFTKVDEGWHECGGQWWRWQVAHVQRRGDGWCTCCTSQHRYHMRWSISGGKEAPAARREGDKLQWMGKC